MEILQHSLLIILIKFLIIELLLNLEIMIQSITINFEFYSIKFVSYLLLNLYKYIYE